MNQTATNRTAGRGSRPRLDVEGQPHRTWAWSGGRTCGTFQTESECTLFCRRGQRGAVPERVDVFCRSRYRGDRYSSACRLQTSTVGTAHGDRDCTVLPQLRDTAILRHYYGNSTSGKPKVKTAYANSTLEVCQRATVTKLHRRLQLYLSIIGVLPENRKLYQSAEALCIFFAG